MVGEVVRLRERLNWFESRPLFAKRILITRPEGQASDFAEELARYGAEPVVFPTVQVLPPEDWTQMDEAVARLGSYDWIIFTSANGVRYFRERVEAAGKDLRALNGARVCAIGPKTAAALRQSGIAADLIPKLYQAEGIIEEMQKVGVRNQRILLPRAQEAREILPEALRRMGARVDVIPAYRNIKPVEDLERVRGMLVKRQVAVVTFTSSSTARNFAEMFGHGELGALLEGVTVASIGPITARTVEEVGLVNHVMPKKYTIPDLALAIADYFNHR